MTMRRAPVNVADTIEIYDAVVESCRDSGCAVTPERVAYMLGCSVRYAQSVLQIGEGADIDRARVISNPPVDPAV